MKIREIGTAILDIELPSKNGTLSKLFNKLRGFVARIWQAVKWPLILLVIIGIVVALIGPMATAQAAWVVFLGYYVIGFVRNLYRGYKG